MTKRKIPATIATQHPDNYSAPYWLSPQTPYVSASEEVEECFRMFSDMDCEEYMWDWEGKFVDEAVIDRLFFKFEKYFVKNQLGRDKFLTFRIPNIWNEKGFRLARAFMGILTAAQSANELGINTPPLFEVILPMTTSAEQLIAIVNQFNRVKMNEKNLFGEEFFKKRTIEMIPLIEGSISLLESKDILKKYAKGYEKITGKKMEYIRPFIARSDPALDSGIFPATMAARAALSQYYDFERETKIKVYPLMGAGSLLFRGGLSPTNYKRFIELYPGTRTVSIQSAFRYDYPLDQAKKVIQFFNNNLDKLEPVTIDPKKIVRMLELAEMMATIYQDTILKMAHFINSFAVFIPKNRERIPHTGHFGYSRQATDGTILPRAITFSAVLYSLGIPPSLIGTGRAIKQALAAGYTEAELEIYYPGHKLDLIQESECLNIENLELLAQKDKAFKLVAQDIQFLKSYLASNFTPTKPSSRLYRNATSSCLQYYLLNQTDSLKSEIIKTASFRRSLG